MSAGLEARWAAVAADAGLAPSPDLAAAGRDLLARYREAGRHYHDGGHLLAVLRALDELAAPGSPSAALRLAAWYHDAVYDPTAAAGDNERRSAELAERGLARLGVAAPLVADVASLVRATATHRLDGIGAPLVAEAALFLDADLAVLGGTAAEYDRYADGIRREYGHLDEATYRAGRAAVLQRFAERDRLYLSAAGVARFEAAARANLDRELAALRGS